MLFRGRFDKQIEHIKEQRGDAKRVFDEDDLRNVLEKNDVLAMILSAMITIVPVALVFLVVLSAIGFFFIVR